MIQKIKQSFKCAHNLNQFIFQLGYSGVELPRIIRCIFAKSSLHKSWLSGFYGGGILPILDRQLEDKERMLIEENYNSYNEAYKLGYSSERALNSSNCLPPNAEDWFINAWHQGRSDACTSNAN